jgi:glycosyltransferase involved in cell wall biosynthesis
MIKVKIVNNGHSVGRGVGYYSENLIKALSQLPEVKITDKNADLDHYPFFDLFYPTLPFFKSKPTVITIHDLTPLVMSDRYPKGVRGFLSLIHQRLALWNVKAIITDSQHSKGDIVKLFNFDFEKVFVTTLAADETFSKSIASSILEEVKEKYHLPKKFVLNVSAGPNPNKNLPALAEATKALNIPLVIVGKGMLQEVTEPIHPELVDLVTLKKYSHIIYLGFVPTEDLAAIYRIATLYCQPSLYEGFGLPLLEAMRSGCLIVSSNSSSLPEIYHQDALTFDPKNYSEMKNVLSAALELSPSQKELQIKQAKEKSEKFTWEITAKETLEVYKKVIC